MTKAEIARTLLTSIRTVLAKSELTKAIGQGSGFLHENDGPPKTTDGSAHSRMPVPAPVQPTVDDFNANILNHPEKKPVVDIGSLADGNDHGIMEKGVVKSPTGQNFMLKKYHDPMFSTGGWAEHTSQALYHAGGIGHLHQKTHIAHVPNENGGEPSLATVVHMDPNVQTYVSGFRGNKLPPEVHQDLHKIAAMDYLTHNVDRHGGNLMFSKDGKRALAIDHGAAFEYEGGIDYHHATNVAMRATDQEHPFTPEVRGWWKQHSPAIKAEFANHVNAIVDPNKRAEVGTGFAQRSDTLDKYSASPGLQYSLLNPHLRDEETTAVRRSSK